MRAARAMAVCILTALAMSAVNAADDKDVVKDIKARLDATVVGVNDFTVREESKTTVGGKEVTTTVLSRYKGIKYRVEVEAAGLQAAMKHTTIFDGKDKWILTQGTTQKRPADPGSAKGVFWWRAIPDGAAVAGSEKLGDRECYLIRYRRTETGPYTTMWVDKANLHLLKTEGSSAGQKVTSLYSDYKKVRGNWEYAHQWEIQVQSKENAGVVRVTSVVKSVEVNTGLADDLFDANAAK